MLGGEQGFDTESAKGSRTAAIAIRHRINLLLLAIAFAVCLSLGLTYWSAIQQDEITRADNISLARR